MTAHIALRTPTQRGRAGWNAILPDPSPAQTLEQDQTADVTIIGAGFAGLSAARRLRQLAPDVKIIVLEAGRLGEGAAGRNSGFMIDLPHNLPGADQTAARGEAELIALNRQAQDFAEQAVLDYGIDRAFFQRSGKINGAVDARTEAILRHEKAHLESTGEDHEMLNAANMRYVTGSDYYTAGLYTPGTVMLQPAGYIRGLAAGLRRKGVAILEDSAATGFRRDGAGWMVETAKAKVSTGKVILGVNGHLESFGFATGRLMQLFLFGAMTPDLTPAQMKAIGGEPSWGITPADPMGATVRRIDKRQGGNRIIVRAAAALRSDMTSRASDLARAEASMQKRFDARFPALSGLRMEHCWAGHLCLSQNGVAVMGEIDRGVYAACVQNGLGTARGTLTGIGAAELAMGETSTITRRFTAEPAPKKLPPQPFRDIGGNLVLRWQEWRAGRA